MGRSQGRVFFDHGHDGQHDAVGRGVVELTVIAQEVGRVDEAHDYMHLVDLCAKKTEEPASGEASDALQVARGRSD